MYEVLNNNTVCVCVAGKDRQAHIIIWSMGVSPEDSATVTRANMEDYWPLVLSTVNALGAQLRDSIQVKVTV